MSTHRVPKYLRQKRRGRADQALTIIDGQRRYLGVWNSPESKRKYAELISAAPARKSGPPRPRVATPPTVAEVMAAYLPVAKRENQRSHWYSIRLVMRTLREQFEDLPAADFRAKRLTGLRDHWVALGWSRLYVNAQVNKLRKMFKWAAAQEMIPPETHASLMMVEHLHEGKSEAHDNPPVEPVSDSLVAATLPLLPLMIACMVRVQRLCGCRPGELCRIRKRDINRSSDVWVVELKRHKTMRHKKRRFIHFGPKAQALLLPYLVCGDDDPIFPIRRGSYRQAIKRACERNGIEHWFPNQLRHTAGAEVREQLGLEAAQLHLGHSRANMTEHYAEVSQKKAIEVARRIG